MICEQKNELMNEQEVILGDRTSFKKIKKKEL